MQQVLENFMGYSNQKAEKKILSRSGVILILLKCLKSQKNRYISRNIEFHAHGKIRVIRVRVLHTNTNTKNKKNSCDDNFKIIVFLFFN
jgi:hypothetical protein